MQIYTKRIYDPPSDSDGQRILIDRIWPRGLSREKARLDYWARDCAPSTELRKWYHHDPDKWEEFRKRYFAELNAAPQALETLRPYLQGKVTLLFASRETSLNNATALKQYLQQNPL